MDLNKLTYFLITGASKGIGKCLAIECSKTFKPQSLIVLMARSQEGLNNTKRQILELNNKIIVLTYAVDLAQMTSKEYDKKIEESLNGRNVSEFELAFIIHNVGSIGDVRLKAKSLEHISDWQNYFNLNVFSVAALNSKFIEIFCKNKKLIINVTSKCAIVPFKSMTFYSSGKAAREMYFRVLAEEETDIIVLNYSPGPVDTDMSMEIQNNSIDPDIKGFFENARNSKEILSVEQTTKKFMKVLIEYKFKSGDHIDYYDDE